MKRSCPSSSLKRSKRCINWSKCFVCQENTKKKSLRSTNGGRKALAENLFKCWEAGNLDFDVSDEFEFKDGKPDFHSTFELKCVQYHHDCAGGYRKKAKSNPKVESNCESTEAPQTRSGSVAMPVNTCYCIFCSEFDDHSNLKAAGTYHAYKEKVNTDHNQFLTDKWKYMAVVTGNQTVLTRLADGDLAANSIFYHRICACSFWNDYKREIKKTSGQSSSQINDHMAKKLAFYEVVKHLNSHEAKSPGSSYIVSELEDIYLKCLQTHGITKKSHITDFTALLLQKIPSLEIT